MPGFAHRPVSKDTTRRHSLIPPLRGCQNVPPDNSIYRHVYPVFRIRDLCTIVKAGPLARVFPVGVANS